jgi:hypothetical protein
MSVCGPMVSPSSTTKRRVILRSSFFDSSFGLQMMPPFAAEGDVGHGAFPGHPRRQRAHFVGGDVGVIADAALAGAAHARMQRAIADERLHAAVVRLDRELQRGQARHGAEVVAQSIRQIDDVVRRGVELLLRDAVGVEVFCGVDRRLTHIHHVPLSCEGGR